MEKIGAVYYINLEHRRDRREQMETELARFGFSQSQIHRIDAIPKPGRGILGCGMSHAKAVETFLASGHEYGLIFEDDFTLTLDANWSRFLLKTLFEEGTPFDLVMLAGNIMKDEPGPLPYLRRVLDGQTASAYILRRDFAPALLANLREGLVLLEDHYNQTNSRKHEYCNDQYWKKLQPGSRWYIFHPKLGIQRESYSDNEERVTNYGV